MENLKLYTDYTVIAVLSLMGFIALWFCIERILFFKRVDQRLYKSKESFENALTSNLTALHIIYSNAPYIGLLGTVIGIMITFYDMGLGGNIQAATIMTGLSLALKATALGLVVAIPTLMAYNALARRAAVIASLYKETYGNE